MPPLRLPGGNKDGFQNTIRDVGFWIRFIRSFDDGNWRLSSIRFIDNNTVLLSSVSDELLNDVDCLSTQVEETVRLEENPLGTVH